MRSYVTADCAGYDFDPSPAGCDLVGTCSENGQVWVGRQRAADVDDGKSPAGFYWSAGDAGSSDWAGPAWRTFRVEWGTAEVAGWREWGAYLPHWPLALASAAPAAAWLVRARRRRRRSGRGLCSRCGYDLRASPARCPECGTPAPNQSATSSSA